MLFDMLDITACVILYLFSGECPEQHSHMSQYSCFFNISDLQAFKYEKAQIKKNHSHI